MQTTDGFSTGNGIEGYYIDGTSMYQSDIQSESKETHVVICICRSTRVILVPLPRFRWCMLLHQALLVKTTFVQLVISRNLPVTGENPLLFCKDLGDPTTADLELRLCTSTKTNEMVGFDKIDIYIQ